MVAQSHQLQRQVDTVEKPDAGRQVGESLPSITDELTEALTAIANYLAAGRTLLEREKPAQLDGVRTALRKAQTQTVRASAAVKRLHRLAAENGHSYRDNSSP